MRELRLDRYLAFSEKGSAEQSHRPVPSPAAPVGHRVDACGTTRAG
jgi:hypothetical protein